MNFMTIIYDLYWQSSPISFALIIPFDFYLPRTIAGDKYPITPTVIFTHDYYYDYHQ